MVGLITELVERPHVKSSANSDQGEVDQGVEISETSPKSTAKDSKPTSALAAAGPSLT
jgi:hypothetical protein